MADKMFSCWLTRNQIDLYTDFITRLICKLRVPYPWRQFDDTLRRVLTDALQHINQVSIGLNVLQLAGRQ